MLLSVWPEGQVSIAWVWGGTLSAHKDSEARIRVCLPDDGFRTPTEMMASGIFYGDRPAPQ